MATKKKKEKIVLTKEQRDFAIKSFGPSMSWRVKVAGKVVRVRSGRSVWDSARNAKAAVTRHLDAVTRQIGVDNKVLSKLLQEEGTIEIFQPEVGTSIQECFEDVGTTWAYRIIRSESGTVGIHEVYFDIEGKPSSCSEERMAPTGDSIEELTKDMELMQLALTKPVLEMKDLD